MSDEMYRPTRGAVPPSSGADATRVVRQPGHVPATGEVLGGFVLRESLGHGGFAHVYRAESAAHGEVALKVLTNSEAGSRGRFVTEANLLEQLRGRGFPDFVKAGLDDPTPWFAMELVPGPTLAQVVHENGPLARQDLLRVADDVADALAVLQEEHYLHRDVKPANIIVSGGRCVLIDLGIAKGHGSQTSTHAAGTLSYMAPELFTRKPHPRSDVYSLGLLLIFCATGTLPADLNFAGRDLTAEDVGPVDPAILPLVLAMTRQDPADRPPLHNIARAVVSVASQQAPEPSLLDAAETTRTERDVMTEAMTAGSLAAGAAAVGAAAGYAAGSGTADGATQVMPPATQAGGPAQGGDPATQVMGAGAGQTEVFSPTRQTPPQAPAGPPPESIRPGPPPQYSGQQYPGGQQYADQRYPGQQYPGQGYPGQQPGSPFGPGGQGGPGGQQPSSSRRDQRDDADRRRGDDAAWRAVSMILGLIPAVLLGIAVYQLVRLIPGFEVMPDLSRAPLFRALGDWMLVTLNLPLEWADTMANLAIPLLGLVLAGILNAVLRIAGKDAGRRRLWPYFLTIGVWVGVLAVQGIVSAVSTAVEDARNDIGTSVEQGIEDQKKNIQDKISGSVDEQKANLQEQAKEQFDEQQENVQEQAKEQLEEQQENLQEQAKETGEDLLDGILP